MKLRDGGWVYVQGLTHYEINDNNEFLIVDLITKDNWSTIEISERHSQYRGGRFMKDERHVLMIFPHPDDETFSSGRSQVILKMGCLSLMPVSH